MKFEQSQEELEEMIADHMEKGFLDNIVDMFKHDKTLYPIVSKLIKDERMRVRIGAIALIESLREINFDGLDEISNSLLPLLEDDNPVVRGDVAYSLGIIGLKKDIPFLEKMLNDKAFDVRTTARESIEEILICSGQGNEVVKE